MRVGSLFAGYDGLGLAVESLWPGSSPAWFVEFDPAPSRILANHWPAVPNYGNVTAVDWAAIEPVDVLTGGFPCQDLSHAGKRAGLKPGTRSGLWTHMAYAIDQLRPQLVLIENVRGILSAEAHSDLERDCWCVGDEREPTLRALGAVLGDLADIGGYDVRWCGLRAADVGAPHGRFRVFIVAQPADSDGSGGDQAFQHDGGGTQGAHWAGIPDQSGGDPDGLGPERMTLLPTPKASDGPNGGPGMRNGRGEADALPGVVALLPAPQAHDAVGGKTPEQVAAMRARGHGAWNLNEEVNLLPTPTVGDSKAARNSTATRHILPPTGIHAGNTLTDIAEPPGGADFGPYAPAIARWERVLGRPAPSPTEPGRDGRARLSPPFVEWLMGLPAGHVTDPALGLSRAQQLKALGNGVVPQQAAAALRMLLGVTR